MLSAISILLFVLSTAAVFATAKVLGIASLSGPIALASGLFVAVAVPCHRGGWRWCSMAAVVLLVSLAASSWLGNHYFDVSSDGAGYHQEAILELAGPCDLLHGEMRGTQALYTSSYPKLAWYWSAAWLACTGNVHMAKNLGFLLVFAAAIVALRTFHSASWWQRWLAAVAVVANPIALVQLFTHYVDGLLASCLTLAILGMIGFFLQRRGPEWLLVTILALIGCASLKHTGLVLATCLLLTGAMLAWRLRVPIRMGARPTTSMLLAILAVVLLGNPYVTNLRRGHHVFHPAMGEHRVPTLVSGQTTRGFSELHPLSKLLRSVFGQTENSLATTPTPYPKWKVPFHVTGKEVVAGGQCDVRWGGWGPLFGGVLLATAILALARGRLLGPYAILLVALAVLSVINPESWWARFNPQLHTLIALILALLMFLDRTSCWIATCGLLTLLANSTLVTWSQLEHMHWNNGHIKTLVRELAAAGSGEVQWQMQTVHLEPIFDRLGVPWTASPAADGRRTLARQILGETVYALSAGTGR